MLLGRPTTPGLETVNDKESYLANFWRAIQWDSETVAHYADWPVNETDLHARHRWLVAVEDFHERIKTDPYYFDPQVAGYWVWGIAMWIGSGWCRRPEWQGRAHAGRDARGIQTRPEVHGKKPRVDRSNLAGTVHSNALHNKRPLLSHGGCGVARKALDSSEWQQKPHLSDGGRGVARKALDSSEWRARPALSQQGQGIAQKSIMEIKRPALCGRSMPGVHRQLPALYGNKGIASPQAGIYDLFEDLSNRLRRVRVCCGDWTRVVTPSVTYKIGGKMLSGIFLDPPYSSEAGRDGRLYNEDCLSIAHDVRAWALENGGNPLMRIALCGYEGEHEMPADWTCVPWKASGGYGNAGDNDARANADRERIWFNKSCLKPSSQSNFEF